MYDVFVSCEETHEAQSFLSLNGGKHKPTQQHRGRVMVARLQPSLHKGRTKKAEAGHFQDAQPITNIKYTSSPGTPVNWYLKCFLLVWAIAVFFLEAHKINVKGYYQVYNNGLQASGDKDCSDHLLKSGDENKADQHGDHIVAAHNLPDMTSEKGGIVFFLHVPKTGGLTVQDFMKTNKPDHVEILIDRLTTKTVPAVEEYFASQNRRDKILYIEIHAENQPITDLAIYLRHWREQSRETGVPFFAFTLMRDAVQTQVSFFNFFYLQPGDPRLCDLLTFTHRPWRCSNNGELELFNGVPETSMETIETNMLEQLYDNFQCLFISRGYKGWGKEEKKRFQRTHLYQTECQYAYRLLQESMDWIGDTARLSQVTMPMLSQIMFNEPYVRPKKTTNKSTDKVDQSQRPWTISFDAVSNATRAKLLAKSLLDQEQLYEPMQKDFPETMWNNFRPLED